MAGNEATIRASLQIKVGELDYGPSRPTSFLADVAGSKGPVPGAMTCSTAGTDVDFGELTTPALCRIQNLDATNFVTVGVYDPETYTLYPVMELLPGESYVIRLSRDLAWEYGTAPGTGTTGAETNRLRIKANAAACDVLVEAFEV